MRSTLLALALILGFASISDAQIYFGIGPQPVYSPYAPYYGPHSQSYTYGGYVQLGYPVIRPYQVYRPYPVYVPQPRYHYSYGHHHYGYGHTYHHHR